MGKRHFAALLGATPIIAISVIASGPAAVGQTGAQHRFQLPAQPLDSALQAVAVATGRNIAAPAELIRDRTAPALNGVYSAESAVAMLLVGSSLRSRSTDDGIVISEDVPAASAGFGQTDGSAIVVTGSRIRGAPIASPVIRIDQIDMVRSGQTSLTDLVRSLPQGFGGGINVGIGLNAGEANGDYGGASTFNLRGVGPDATLTLLNGKRLAYNGARQGVDVSAIPLGAVDRIEIVPDGSSALYGSDAVAGVANIILRRDFDGLKVEADGGLATDGGYDRQRYGATAGRTWRSGGFILSYEYARSTALRSEDRSFTEGRPGVTIYPPLARHAVLLSGHQDITGALTFSVDLLYNRRTTSIVTADNEDGDTSIGRFVQGTITRSYAVAPSLTLALGDDWRASLSGVYGNDRTRTKVEFFAGDAFLGASSLCYCNSGKSVELAADGGVVMLPGGEIRAAFGVGYRNNVLNAFRGAGNPRNVDASQDSYFGYGEVSLPLASPASNFPGVNRLNASAALRYERYPGIDAVATPKFGLIYGPSPDLDLKLSWGRAFRAPSLLQQYGVLGGYLYAASERGGIGYPADATALRIFGGNPDLKPERARTWTASLDMRPSALPGARLQLSYFNARYKDRIIDPGPFASRAISDPLYADLVTLNPSLATSIDAIASLAQYYVISGGSRDPANIVAIIDTRNQNASRQNIQGVDILGDYRRPLGGGTLIATLNASYLHVEQQLFAGQPVMPRAGLLFTPPHWRGRASLAWVRGETSLDMTLSILGGVDDRREDDAVRVRGMTTLDLTARHRLLPEGGPLGAIDLTMSVMNAFNAKPARIASTSSTDSTYDSTNYSPLGRIINFGISKTW